MIVLSLLSLQGSQGFFQLSQSALLVSEQVLVVLLIAMVVLFLSFLNLLKARHVLLEEQQLVVFISEIPLALGHFLSLSLHVFSQLNMTLEHLSVPLH